MGSSNEFEGHGGSSLDGIESATGRAKPTVTSERDKLSMVAFWTTVKSPTEGRITAVDHLLDVFHFDIAGMASVFNFFVMIAKDLLKNVHK